MIESISGQTSQTVDNIDTNSNTIIKTVIKIFNNYFLF